MHPNFHGRDHILNFLIFFYNCVKIQQLVTIKARSHVLPSSYTTSFTFHTLLCFINLTPPTQSCDTHMTSLPHLPLCSNIISHSDITRHHSSLHLNFTHCLHTRTTQSTSAIPLTPRISHNASLRSHTNTSLCLQSFLLYTGGGGGYMSGPVLL